eukprot:CAMPEP_0194028456 /NCGR_PEP_ID=MMETSP0009_2-20130614/2411_1 /TAXON_ID=210454 /ORGANISM="Grammatophora oceanica, Strain CCMP 410" /LENGTH=183 /DNA_ID=CAMNT_0038667851 /DNA_START=34 /DNA_END=585 /DNA_ORIENTATION=-
MMQSTFTSAVAIVLLLALTKSSFAFTGFARPDTLVREAVDDIAKPFVKVFHPRPGSPASTIVEGENNLEAKIRHLHASYQRCLGGLVATSHGENLPLDPTLDIPLPPKSVERVVDRLATVGDNIRLGRTTHSLRISVQASTEQEQIDSLLKEIQGILYEEKLQKKALDLANEASLVVPYCAFM